MKHPSIDTVGHVYPNFAFHAFLHLFTDKLKFVEAPKGGAEVHGKFGRTNETGRVFVSGFVNVKTDAEWHPIYNYKCTYPRGDFGDHEANVTCKDGGYSSGSFVRYVAHGLHFLFTCIQSKSSGL